MKKPDFLLVKFFETEQFANEFRSGKLYANRLSYFRQLENDQRADRFEGVFSLPPKEEFAQMEFIIREEDREIKYTNDEISRIWVAPTEVSCLNVFCMYMCRVPEGLNHNGEAQLTVPSRCVSDFGKFPVVVLDPVEFINRYKKAAMLSECKAVGCGPVRYLEIDDRSSFVFSLALSKAPSFNYQQEFRLIFHVNREDNPISLNVGDVRDITSVGSVVFGDSEVADSTSRIIYCQ